MGARAIVRTSGESEEGKKGRTWSVERCSDCKSEGVAVDVLSATSSDPLRYGFFFGGPSKDYFSDHLLLGCEQGLRVALSKERGISSPGSCPSVFMITTSC